MRLPVFSSESMRLPFRWSLARRSSSAGSGSPFMRRSSSRVSRTTSSTESRLVPA